MDEACATIRTEIDSMPQELDEVTRRVMQLRLGSRIVKRRRSGQPRTLAKLKELAEPGINSMK